MVRSRTSATPTNFGCVQTNLSNFVAKHFPCEVVCVAEYKYHWDKFYL